MRYRTLVFLGILLLSLLPAAAFADPAALPNGFSYQGYLTDGGVPANGSYDFQFRYFDAAGAGSQIGSAIAVNDLAVAQGLFTTILSWPTSQYFGQTLYLQISVRPGASAGAFTTLTPRQQLAPALSALFLPGVYPVNGRVGIGNFSPGAQLDVRSEISTTTAVFGVNLSGDYNENGIGIEGRTYALGGTGVLATSKNTALGPSFALKALAESGFGVYAESKDGTAIGGFAANEGDVALLGHATALTGSGKGVVARTNSPSGVGLQVENGGTSSATAEIIRACSTLLCGDIELRLRRNGNLSIDGAFSSGGADYADLMLINGDETTLAPGDVLVIGANGRIELSTAANDRRVAGVYSTRPSLVGNEWAEETEYDVLAADAPVDSKVPVALVGVVPVKVSAENGAIVPGDLLTTAALAGHAMKATPVNVQGVEIYPTGTILGKALEPLAGGTGVIRVLLVQR